VLFDFCVCRNASRAQRWICCAGRVLRKSGLTTSRSGELVLSDADETLKRRTLDRQRDCLTSGFHSTPSTASTASNSDEAKTVTGPILTVNSVSNPASARRTDSSSAASVSGRRPMPSTTASEPRQAQSSMSERRYDDESQQVDLLGRYDDGRSTARQQSDVGRPGQAASEPRRAQSSMSERRYSFDDESQQFDWSAAINLLSRYDDGQSTVRQQSEAGRPRRVDAAEPPIVATRAERCGDWEATLPSYMPSKPDSADRDGRRSRTLSGQRGYSSDSEGSTDWLERQKRRARQRTPSTTSTPATTTIKARIVFPPPRAELERRLVDELRASQERLNLDKASHRGGPRNGLYSSCTLPLRSSSSTLSRGQSLTNGFYDTASSGDTGRFSSLPGKRRTSAGSVQRASSELDFSENTTRLGPSTQDNWFDKHRSMTSLRGGDTIVEQRISRTTASRRTGALLILLIFRRRKNTRHFVVQTGFFIGLIQYVLCGMLVPKHTYTNEY